MSFGKSPEAVVAKDLLRDALPGTELVLLDGVDAESDIEQRGQDLPDSMVPRVVEWTGDHSLTGVGLLLDVGDRLDGLEVGIRHR